ncbi:IPTL-CTERM sorting domain-containing protein [Xylophilus sp. ASV27]|uniref:IPTL-CTERM sorting domain-containing protein n=1 Tax=Xylophilus sp. ASV27 TaxID=2795129 RepID=UPI00351C3619
MAAVLAALLCGPAMAQVVVPANSSLDVPAGGMDLGCTPLQVLGTVNITTGLLSGVGDLGINPGGTVNGGQGTITVGGDWSDTGQFNAGTGSVVFTDACSAGDTQFTGTTVFNNLTLSSTTGRTFVIPAGALLTVNGTLTLQGAPGQPLNLVSSSGQTAVIALGPNAQVVRSNVSQAANVQIGAAAQGVAGIPTLDRLGLALLTLLLAAAALWQGQAGRTFRKSTLID